MQPLRILVFRDGRPGHEKQSRGIVEALRRYRHLEVIEHLVASADKISDFTAYCRFFLHLDKPLECDGPVDLFIASGARTHIPALCAKRRSGAGRVVVCMSPPRGIRKQFDLCFVPVHDRLSPAPNLFFTVGPPNPALPPKARHSTRALILVGGIDPQSHVWDERALMKDITTLVKSSKKNSWVLASSPRTPLTTESRLRELSSGYKHVDFVPFADTSPGWIEQQYREFMTVWITGDSISMVYEALSAGCRVGILPVKWKKCNNKFQFSERYLQERQRVITFSQWQAGGACWTDHEPLNEADRCAREILRRWWPKSLQ